MIRLFEALARPLVLRALLFLVAAGLLAGFDYGGVVARLAEIVPALASPTGQGVGPWLVIAGLAALVVVNFWLLSHLPFRLQAVIVWIELMGLFLAFCWSFRLSYGFMLQRAPILLGLQLHDGFIQGAALTLFICLVSITLSTVIALAAALARLSDSGPAYGLATFYTSFFRGTPLLLQTMLIYLGLPQLGLVIDAIPAGIIALSLCYGAYMAEIFRAGILSVPRGQIEAAMTVGLSGVRAAWLVTLPQALRVALPAAGGQYQTLAKASSLAAAIGYPDIMQIVGGTVASQTSQALEAMALVVLSYAAINLAIALLVGLANRGLLAREGR